jgi:hypothetical protein
MESETADRGYRRPLKNTPREFVNLSFPGHHSMARKARRHTILKKALLLFTPIAAIGSNSNLSATNHVFRSPDSLIHCTTIAVYQICSRDPHPFSLDVTPIEAIGTYSNLSVTDHVFRIPDTLIHSTTIAVYQIYSNTFHKKCRLSNLSAGLTVCVASSPPPGSDATVFRGAA